MSSRRSLTTKIGVSVFIFFAIIMTLVVILFFTSRGNDHNDSSSIHRSSIFAYQHLRYNPETNEKSTSIVNFDFNPFGESENNKNFLFYQGEGNYHLISNFESSKSFICSGSCYCHDDSKRRSQLVFRNGLVYLLAASTTLIASNIAKDYFDEQCHSEKCPDGTTVISETDSCEEIETKIPAAKKDEKEQCDTCVCEGKEHTIYVCKGNCIPSRKFDDHPRKKKVIDSNEQECFGKKMEQALNTAIFCESEVKELEEEGGVYEVERMKIYFLGNFLNDRYCESVVAVPEEEDEIKGEFPICMAPQIFSKTHGGNLPSQIADANIECTNIKDTW